MGNRMIFQLEVQVKKLRKREVLNFINKILSIVNSARLHNTRGQFQYYVF